MGKLVTMGHYYGVRDDKAYREHLAGLAKAIPLENNCFCADNLITWMKQVSFLDDRELQLAVQATNPDFKELSISWRTHTVTWAARQCLNIEGDFVEAGVYRGHTARVVCNLLDFGKLDRTYWLYDLFDANPDREIQLEGMGSSLYQQVIERFADLPNVRVIKGAVPGSFSQGRPEKIAFMHIDMNSAPAEIGALEGLWERVSPGGIVLLDDFGWAGSTDPQFKAVTAWLRERGRRVLELPTGQGMAIR